MKKALLRFAKAVGPLVAVVLIDALADHAKQQLVGQRKGRRR